MGTGLSDRKADKQELMEIENEAYEAASQLLAAAHPKKGSIFVVGCSTREVAGERIGSFDEIYRAAKEAGVSLAAQCCEHLNRALILEEEAAERYGYEQVNVIPQPKAGGSFATAAYHTFESPVAVEHIRAAAGMDIGDTLIGMHLKEVAVPVRIERRQIGAARVICARTRLKFTGGARAIYDETLL